MKRANMTPKSISQIYCRINAKWFRVRNVITLRDYLVFEFTHLTIHTADPRWARAICLDDQIYSVMDCTEKKWALLSSDEELSQFRRYKRSAVITDTIQSYHPVREEIHKSQQLHGFKVGDKVRRKMSVPSQSGKVLAVGKELILVNMSGYNCWYFPSKLIHA